MKRFLSSILISFIIFANLLAPISVVVSEKNKLVMEKNIVSADDCEIISAVWSGNEVANNIRPENLTLAIKTLNCEGKRFGLKLWETSSTFKKIVESVDNLSVTTDDFSINFKPGEENCSDGNCNIQYEILLNTPNSTFSAPTTKKQDDTLTYKCTSNGVDAAACDDTKPWSHTLEAGAKLESDYEFNISPTVQASDTVVSVKVDVGYTIKSVQTLHSNTSLSTRVILRDSKGAEIETLNKEFSEGGGIQEFTFNKDKANKDLASDTDYIVSISIIETSTTTINLVSSTSENEVATVPDVAVHTNKFGNQNIIDQGAVAEINMTSSPNSNPMPACSITGGLGGGSFTGCIAQAFYYVLFIPTSYLFALAGTFFDNTFAYSVQDTSYRSSFVVQGWGLVRDFCNLFFIFILLYVALATTLSLHGFKTKETIINVVIIGLFINFSLFATQIIIDASNITARVFYNANTITITEKGANGVAEATPGLTVAEGGVIPLSAALVNIVNPQNLIINAKKINSVPVKGGDATVQDNDGGADSLTAGSFILIVMLASAVNIVGFIVFLSVGLIFITRVIGLWIAMIIAPLAFFTYILPEMQGAKMIGWKNWWPETLKLAFLAPIFIFFLYLILKFLKEINLISDPINKDGLTFFIATIIPFAFIMILLMKAKKIATDMAGELGEMASKAGAAVGGLALGAATGGAALAMRGTLGNLGNKIGESNWAQTHGRLGRMVGDAGKWTGSKTFDARNTKLGAAAGKGLGVDLSGKESGLAFAKVQEGGYTKHQEEVATKRRARAESLKLKDHSEPVQKLHAAEESESQLKNANKNDTDRIDGTLIAKRKEENSLYQRLQNANKKLEKEPANEMYIAEAAEAQDLFDKNAATIADFAKERIELNGAKGRHADKTADGKVNEAAYNDIVTDVTTTKNALAEAEADSVKKINEVTQAAQKKIDDNIKKAENELKVAEDALREKEKIGGANPSPKEQAVIQELKNSVDAAKNNLTTVKDSGDEEITKEIKKAKEINNKIIEKAKTKVADAEKLFNEMTIKKNAKGFSKTVTIKGIDGKPEQVVSSLDNLTLKLIPQLHHHVEEENAERIKGYSDKIRGRLFNKRANDKAAHEAIMGSEIKKH